MSVSSFEYIFFMAGTQKYQKEGSTNQEDKSGGKDLNECISVLCYMSPILFPIISKSMADSQTF